MKKLTGILIAAALLLAPISASALEMMTDASMKDVTGQAGVSIAIDDVVLEQWVGTTTYTDTDGTDGTAGSVVISDQHTVHDFQAITSAGSNGLVSPNVGLQNPGMDGTARMAIFNPANGNYIGTGADNHLNAPFQSHALSIDVGTCSALSAGKSFNTNNLFGIKCWQVIQYCPRYYHSRCGHRAADA